MVREASPLQNPVEFAQELGAYRDLIEGSGILFWTSDLEGHLEHLDPVPMWEGTLGHSAEKLRAHRLLRLVHPDDREELRRALLSPPSQTENPMAMVRRFRHADDSWRWLSLRFRAGVSGLLVLGTAVDVTAERVLDRRALEEYEDQIRELREKNTELERFAYSVSHDLRTPLFTIKGFLGLLAKSVAEGDQQQILEDLQRIRGAADRMGELLEDVLRLSKIGHVTSSPEDIDLRELVSEAVELLTQSILDRGVEVQIETLPGVFGDRVRLLEVFQNLLENAIKYMGDQESPRVVVQAKRQGDEVVCRVSDNGIGIEPRFQDQIFDLFHQLDPEMGGTGCGLALIKRIVEAHDGRIWVESAGLGDGTTFVFSLPAAVAED